jgi:hypothetical protein
MSKLSGRFPVPASFRLSDRKHRPAGVNLNVTKAIVSDIYHNPPRVTPDVGGLTGGGTA